MAGLEMLSSLFGGGGGSKATSTSSSGSSASATNALNLAFNPNVTSTVGGQLWPYSSGDSYGNPASNSSGGTATATPTETNPSTNLPWYYPGGTGTYDVGSYRGTGATGTVGSTSTSSNTVLFVMIGFAMVFMISKH